MKKVKYLFIANSSIPSKEKYLSKDDYKISSFEKSSIEVALECGFDVYMGINRKYAVVLKSDYPVKFYNANIYRSIFDIKNNIIAFLNLYRFLKRENIDIIHCNTPIGGFLGRICGKLCGVKKILYTAHGFHFYKGASLVNNILFKSIEKWLARFTDVIITITQEDFKAVQNFKLKKNGKTYYMPGVGIDLSKIQNTSIIRDSILSAVNASKDDILLISVGELNKNKNNLIIIKALAKISNPKFHYIICGEGDLENDLKYNVKKYSLENNIHFLGFRSDIFSLLKSSDIFVLPSHREGLSRSLMEAMSAGLPCIVSKVRGNVDLVQDGVGGFLRESDDINGFAEAINTLASNQELRKKMKNNNLQSVQKFDIENVKKEILKIYSFMNTVELYDKK